MTETKYQAFFVSINSKNGIPDVVQKDIIDGFKKYCIEYDCVPEQTKMGKIHLHLMVLTCKAMLKKNFVRTVKNIVMKHIRNDHVEKGIDVKVIKDFKEIVEYMSKTSILDEDFPRLKQYVTENFESAVEIIKENKEYKESKIKYAYDNEDTYIKELDFSLDIDELWIQYKSLRFKNHGRSAPSYFKLQDAFEQILYNAGYIEDKDLICDLPHFAKEYIKREKKSKVIFDKLA